MKTILSYEFIRAETSNDCQVCKLIRLSFSFQAEKDIEKVTEHSLANRLRFAESIIKISDSMLHALSRGVDKEQMKGGQCDDLARESNL